MMEFADLSSTFEHNLSYLVCESSDPSTGWGVTLVIDSFCFLALFILSIVFLVKFIKANMGATCNTLLQRYLIAAAFLIKFIFYFILGIAYFTSMNLHCFKYFLRLFPGYLISSGYIIILYSWSSIFYSYIQGKTKTFFAYFRVILVLIDVVFVLSFFFFFGVYVNGYNKVLKEPDQYNIPKRLQNMVNRSLEIEGIMSTTFDGIIAVLFIIMLYILIFQIGVQWRCSQRNTESVILYLCIMMLVAPIIRLGSRLSYSLAVTSRPNWECSMSQLILIICKEITSQILPLLFVVISDLWSSGQPAFQASVDIDLF